MMVSASVADEVAEVVPAYAIELQGPHLTNVHCPEDNLSITSSSRTPLNQVAALTQAELTNPNLFLSQAIANQTMLGITVLIVSTHTKILISASDVGGGIDNMAFLVRKPPGQRDSRQAAIAQRSGRRRKSDRRGPSGMRPT